MILESSGQGELSNLLDNDIAMGVIGQIGQDLIINSNSNVRIMYDGLRDVGGSLSISNNTNCTFDFSQISTAGSLLITDNTNTTVPLFPYLSRAESIYIHGLIDTSTGPNIFPALEFVSGNVTIEALNDDFDCSKLISQFKEDIIHNLKCNGQNNETIAPEQRLGNGTSTPIPTQNPSFSPGAWAGIGIGAGVAVIGIFGAFIWIIIHYRSRLRKLERKAVRDSDEKLSTGEPEQPQVFQMQEVDGRGIFREKPDDPLVEMHTQPAELPTRPQSWAESEEGDISLAK
ncbi:hypothetical protein E0Z10_g3121 [Xylaria hypoxylon]|uniref:Receptor L-domain domain-containing protein n=1 Tax=Xylaria hypoxylon TaxID=37992 RepID=A0A4Z0Z0E2_9PEZI|nr:hypothetical protein E0Z10_g3121 [Xylaria hypoxylon]